MRKIIIVCSLLIGLFLNVSYCQIQWSGFMDLIYSPLSQEAPFAYGQFEVDISADISEGVKVEGAMALNPESGTFEAGAGFITLYGTTLYNSEWAACIGQFDVPFGLDYAYIPSTDRHFISPPMAIENTFNAWNDLGLSLNMQLKHFSITAFLVNGSENNYLVGGRVAGVWTELLEIGFNRSQQSNENQAGGIPVLRSMDLQSKLGPFRVRGEYVESHALAFGDFDNFDDTHDASAYYIQCNLDLAHYFSLPVEFLLRYGTWKSVSGLDSDGDGQLDEAIRYTGGIRYSIVENFEFRTQYMVETWQQKSVSGNLNVQCVVAF